MKKITSLICASLFLMISFGQQKNNFPQIDSVLSAAFPAVGPGAVVLVAKQGNIIYEKGIGKASIELDVAMMPGMVFQLASVTKQFTAVAILQLMEAGKLKLTDSLQQYLPDYPYKGAAITIEQLLTHTSGIPDYLQLNFNATNPERWDFSPMELIDSFKTRPLLFAPGTEYRYSNSGYYLLGYIIEKITGTSYQDYVRKNIIAPLGLSHTEFDEANNIIPGRVHGYQVADKKLLTADYWSPSITYSAGGLLSNAQDLFKWNEALKAYKVLKKETIDKAWSPHKLSTGKTISYGYGWSTAIVDSALCIYHTGSMTGFLTQQSYFPAEDIYIAVLCNSWQAPRDQIANDVAKIVRGKWNHKSYVPADKILSAYNGTYQLSGNSKRTIKISRENGFTVMSISNQQPVLLEFDSDIQFHLKAVPGVSGVFESEGGKVVRIVIEQNGKFVWEKIK